MISTWQPMDTAPKDGTEILCYVGAGYIGGVVVVNFDEGSSSWVDWDNDTWTPLNWMPLPKPPEQKDE